MDHEEAFISKFVIPKKRGRYLDFLPKPKRRVEITMRFSGFFDFIPKFATQVPRGIASELVSLLRARGAGATAHVIGGRDIDGQDLPLAEAIDKALGEPGGIVVSCIPGRLALLIQEFPPGDTFILYSKP